MHVEQGFVPDCSVRYASVIVLAPLFQLYAGISKTREPVSVQAFSPEVAVEGLNRAAVFKVNVVLVLRLRFRILLVDGNTMRGANVFERDLERLHRFWGG